MRDYGYQSYCDYEVKHCVFPRCVGVQMWKHIQRAYNQETNSLITVLIGIN